MEIFHRLESQIKSGHQPGKQNVISKIVLSETIFEIKMNSVNLITTS
jgi:hypothetical protein